MCQLVVVLMLWHVELAQCLGITVKQFLDSLPPRKPIIIESDVDPIEGFKVLITNRVLSAPVFDKETSAYIGFLDQRDLTAMVVNAAQVHEIAAKKRPKTEKQQPGTEHFLKHLLKAPVEAGSDVKASETPEIVTIPYLSKRNKFIPVRMEDTLLVVCDVMVGTGVHRVPVVDDKGVVTAIISQSTIIAFLHSHAADLKAEFSQTVGGLKLGSRPCLCVKSNQTAKAAFELIYSKNISGIGVIDHEGILVGNTSSSDLKLYVANPSFSLLDMSVLEFLNVIRRASTKDMFPAISVTDQAPISRVIGKLAVTKIHRAFVVDEMGHPLGVISLTDILSVLRTSFGI